MRCPVSQRWIIRSYLHDLEHPRAGRWSYLDDGSVEESYITGPATILRSRTIVLSCHGPAQNSICFDWKSQSGDVGLMVANILFRNMDQGAHRPSEGLGGDSIPALKARASLNSSAPRPILMPSSLAGFVMSIAVGD